MKYFPCMKFILWICCHVCHTGSLCVWMCKCVLLQTTVEISGVISISLCIRIDVRCTCLFIAPETLENTINFAAWFLARNERFSMYVFGLFTYTNTNTHSQSHYDYDYDYVVCCVIYLLTTSSSSLNTNSNRETIWVCQKKYQANEVENVGPT